jgi:DNA-binding transcriptional regulator GbsR (MarR family)
MSPRLQEARQRFVRSWGAMASRWGINKTMARIHALLLVSDRPLSADEVMGQLSISRGNASMNLRALSDWGLVRQVSIGSERREYFESDGDVWEMCCRIARERKKREIEPVISVIEDCLREAAGAKEAVVYRRRLGELLELVKLLDFGLGKVAEQERSAVMPKILKVMKAMS